jgi:hypothetical protein
VPPSYFDELRNARTVGVGTQIEQLRATVQESAPDNIHAYDLSKKLSAASAQLSEGQADRAGHSLDKFLEMLQEVSSDGSPIDKEAAKGWIAGARNMRALLPY